MNKLHFEQQQSRSKDSHDKYDEILRSLHRDLKTPSKLESHIVDMAYLQAKDYLSYQEVPNEINRFVVTLRPVGCVFITEGGYAEQDRLAKEKNDELEQNRTVAENSIKRSNQAYWISIIAIIITIATFLLSVFPMEPNIEKELPPKEKSEIHH